MARSSGGVVGDLRFGKSREMEGQGIKNHKWCIK